MMHWALLLPLSRSLSSRGGEYSSKRSRGYFASTSGMSLKDLNEALCHPGLVGLIQFVWPKKLPSSVEDDNKSVSTCDICTELKPRFCKTLTGKLKKQRSIPNAWKSILKSHCLRLRAKKNVIKVVDEYYGFPFVFPCRDMTAATIIDWFCQLFFVFVIPSCIHSDRGSSFMSEQLKHFLHTKDIAASRTTTYNPV